MKIFITQTEFGIHSPLIDPYTALLIYIFLNANVIKIKTYKNLDSSIIS